MLPRSPAHPGVLRSPAGRLARAAFRSERHATLHAGSAELREERLVGLGRSGPMALVVRDAAATVQALHDAASNAHDYLGDVLVGERRGLLNGRRREGFVVWPDTYRR